MPHNSSSASSSKRDTKRHPRRDPPKNTSSSPSPTSSSKTNKRHLPSPSNSKAIVFGSVEVIPDTTKSRSASSSKPGYKLRRSPTPVLTSLVDLTNAHLSQLSGVWNEKNLPNFEADKRAIAATRDGKDPFDF